MAAFIKRTAGVYVSHRYVATLWHENGLKPHRTGTFKVSKDPPFAEKVTDIVGLYFALQVGPWSCRWTKRRRSSVGPDPADAAERVRCDRETHP
jgi:hypothetical protein